MPTSQNGWTVIPDPGSSKLKALAGFPGSVHVVVHPVMEYVVAEFARRVEPIAGPVRDDWAYHYRTIAGTDVYSNHASGTALDLNAKKHPQGRRGTFTPAQVRELRAILAEVDNVIQWGGDWTRVPDEMHLEIRGSVPEQRVRDVAARLAARPTTSPAPRTITVQAGDGWWQTARRAGVTMSALLATNNADVTRVLDPGDVLKVAPLTVTVRAGEGWWQVASRAGITMDQLLTANRATVDRVLHPGDVLKMST